MELINKLKHAIKHKTMSVTSANDPDFDPDANSFLGMREFLGGLIKTIVRASEQFEAFCVTCGQVGEVFGRYPNETDPPAIQKLCESYSAKMDQLSTSLKTEFKTRIEKDVLTPLVVKFDRMEQVAKLITQRRESKRDYEYYSKKVEEMRKVEKQDAVRNIRNDEKLNKVRMELEKYTYMSNQQIKYYVSKRDKLIKYEFAHFRSIQKEIFQDGFELLKEFVTLPAGERDTVSFDPPNLESTQGMPVLLSSTSSGAPPPLPARNGTLSYGSSYNPSASQFVNSTVPGQSIRPGASSTPFGQSVLPQGPGISFQQSSNPYLQSAVPYGQSATPYGQSMNFNQSVAPYNPGSTKAPIAPLSNLSASSAPAPLPQPGFGKKGFGGFSVTLTKPPLPPQPNTTAQNTNQTNDLFSSFNYNSNPTQATSNVNGNQNVDLFNSVNNATNNGSDPFADLLNSSLPQNKSNNNQSNPPSNSSGGTKYQAVYQYMASAEDELSLEVGDIINVTVQDSSGWWIGTKTDGTEGIFPGKYVVPLKT